MSLFNFNIVWKCLKLWQFFTALDEKITKKEHYFGTTLMIYWHYSAPAAVVWAIIKLKTQLNHFGLKIWQKDLFILKRKTGQYTREAPVLDRKYNMLKQKNPLNYAIKQAKSWNVICTSEGVSKEIISQSDFCIRRLSTLKGLTYKKRMARTWLRRYAFLVNESLCDLIFHICHKNWAIRFLNQLNKKIS